MNKCLILAIVFLFGMSMILVSTSVVKADSTRTLVVPDQYPTIQDAVGNASAGDTVYVKDGTYYVSGVEGLTLGKPLSLVGQDRQATTIEFSGNSYGAGSVIDITADNVALSGFTIDAIGIPTGLHLESSNCKIDGNIIENTSWAAIQSEFDENNVITSNSITSNADNGIYLPSSDSIISNNSITNNNGTAITIDSSENVTVSQNHISDNGNGILIRFYGPFYIFGNYIADNIGFGIQFGENCSNSAVYNNNLIHNQIGIDLMNFATTTSLAPLRVDGYPLGEGNVVYKNNFDNSVNAKVERAFPYDVGYVNNGTDIVSWDKGLAGNSWSNFYLPFFYEIDSNNIDHYPCPYLSPNSIVIIVFVAILAIALISLLMYRRHRKSVITEANVGQSKRKSKARKIGNSNNT